MESGLRQDVGDIPSTVQVCLICLDMDSKLFLMCKNNLEKAYENLTGYSLCDMGNLKQTLCVECAQRLVNFCRFRDKSLRARSLMIDLVNKYQSVTKQHIKSIDRIKNELESNITKTSLRHDDYNSYRFNHLDEDERTVDPLSQKHTDNIIVKNEENYEPTLVEDVVIKMETEEHEDESDIHKDFTIPYDDNVTKNNTMADTKLLNNDQCRVTLENVSSIGVFEIEIQPKHEKDEDEYNMHQAIHFKPQWCSLSTPSTSHHTQTSTSHSTLTTYRNRNHPLLDTAKEKTEVKMHSTDRFEAFNNDELDLKPFYSNNKASGYTCNINNKTKNCVVKITKSATKKVKFNNSKPAKIIRTKNQHLLKKSKNDTKRYICDVCRKEFKRRSHLVRHIKTHSTVKPFACKLCEYKCSWKRDFAVHLKRHSGQKPFVCTICQFECSRKFNLECHIRKHTGEKLFACVVCEYKCSRKNTLVRHMRVHTDEKPFACELCEYKCSRKYTLVRHMRLHTDEKPFACKLCEYKTSLNRNLKAHMRIHSGKKLFECDICEYICLRKTTLLSHMGNHTGEKPFACELCGYKTTVNSRLSAHMTIHTSEKPFACTICKYKSSQKFALVRHMRTHTGGKPFACN